MTLKTEYEKPIIKEMVLFIDQLLTRLHPSFKKLNDAKRKNYISKFFRHAELIKLEKHKWSGDVYKFGDKLYEAMERGRPRGRHDYKDFLSDCVGSCGLRTDWFNFVNALVTIFSREYKLFFEWLLIEIKSIEWGLEILSSHGSTGKSKEDAMVFARTVLMATYVRRCLHHHVSRIKRKEKRKATRQQELAEQNTNINVETSSGSKQLSAEVATYSSETDPTHERANTVDPFKTICAFDGNAQTANPSGP